MIVINYEKILFFSLLYGQSFPSTTDRKMTFVLVMGNAHELELATKPSHFYIIFCIHYLFIYFLLIWINIYMINFTSNSCPFKLKSWHSTPSHEIGTHTNKLMRLCIGCTTSLLCFSTLNLLIKWVSFTIFERASNTLSEECRVCEGNAEEEKK